MVEWSLQDAKNRFSAVVNAALDGDPQLVTRRGQPVVMVIAFEEYERLCQGEPDSAPTFVEHLLAIPQVGDFDSDDFDFERWPLEPRPLEL